MRDTHDSGELPAPFEPPDEPTGPLRDGAGSGVADADADAVLEELRLASHGWCEHHDPTQLRRSLLALLTRLG